MRKVATQRSQFIRVFMIVCGEKLFALAGVSTAMIASATVWVICLFMLVLVEITWDA